MAAEKKTVGKTVAGTVNPRINVGPRTDSPAQRGSVSDLCGGTAGKCNEASMGRAVGRIGKGRL